MRELPPAATLAIAVTCVSSSAVLVRWCQAEALSVSFWRLAIAAAVLWLPALRPGEARRSRVAAFCTPWAVGAGLFLAAHFALWILSLDYTTVAASTFLLSVQLPVAALVSWLNRNRLPGSPQYDQHVSRA